MNPYSNADLRSSIHHHRHHQSRYTSSPSPRPPIHRANFSDNSKSYSPQTLNHQHRHHQSNSHYPPPPSYQLSPSVAPLSPSPRPQLDFTSRPIDDDRARRQLYHHHGHNHHHHHHRLVDCEHRAAGDYESPYVENRSELLDRQEMLTDNRVKRPFSHVDADSDRHIHTVEHRSVSPFVPVESFRHDSDSVSRVRVREDYTEGFESSHQHEDFTRGAYRRLASSARSYDDRREPYDESKFRKSNRRDHRTEKQWSYSGEGSADLVGMTYEARNGKEFEPVPENKEYHGSESSGYNSGSRGGREGVREYNLTPRKQIQKKSAFLRLQMPKPNYRNWNNGHHHSSTHHDANELGSLKGKGQFANVEDGAKDRGEGGSVELDVSFKSNTLIAKAIVPPTSSQLDDQDLSPSNKKLNSAIISDRDSKSSSPGKVKDNMDKSNSSTDKLKETVKKSNSSSDKVKEIVDTSNSSSDKVKEIVNTSNSFSDKVKEIADTSNSSSDKVKEIVDTSNSSPAIANPAISSKDSREPVGKVVALAVEKVGSEGQGAKSVSHIEEDINSPTSKKTHIKHGLNKLIRVLDKGGLDVNSNKNQIPGLDANSNKDKATDKKVIGTTVSGEIIISEKDGANTGCSKGKTLAEAGKKAGPGKNSSVKVKKKKIVKRLVKRVVRDKLTGQPVKKSAPTGIPASSETEKAAGSSEEKVACKDEATSDDLVEKGGSTKCANLLPQIDKGEAPLDLISTEECNKSAGRHLTSSLNDKGASDGCSPPQSGLCGGLISASAYDNSNVNIHSVSSSAEHPTALSDLTFVEISMEKSNCQFPQDLELSLPKKNVNGESCSKDKDIPSSAYDNSYVNIHSVSSSPEHPTALSALTFVESSIEKSNCQLPLDLELSLPKKNVDGESCSKDKDIPSQLVLGESNFHKASDCVVSQARATVSEKECIDVVEGKPCSSITSSILSAATSAQVSQKCFTCLVSDISSSTSEDSFSKNEAIDHRGQSYEMATMPKGGDGTSSVKVNSEEDLKKIVENAGKDGDRISQLGDLNSMKAHVCIDDPIDISCCNPPKSVDQAIELFTRGSGLPAELLLGHAAAGRPVLRVSNGSGSSNDFSEADGSVLGDFLTSPSPHMELPSVGTSQNNDVALVTDKLSYFAERQLTSHECEVESEEGLAISCMDASTRTVLSLSGRQDSCIAPEDFPIAAVSNAVPDSLVQHCHSRDIGSSLEFRESDIATVESLNQLFSESQLEKDHPVINPAHDDQKWVRSPEGPEDLKVNVHPSEDTAIMEVEKPHASSEEPHIYNMSLLSTIADDAGFQSKEESPSVSTHLSLSVCEGVICTSNFANAVPQHVHDSVSEMGFPGSLSILLDAQTSSCEATLNQLCSKGVGENEGQENPLVKEVSISSHSALTPVMPNTKTGKSSNHGMETSGKETNKAAVLSSSNSKKVKGRSSPLSAELYGRRNQQAQVARQTVSGHSSSLSGASKANSANPTSKSNTWRRPSNPSASASGNKPFLGTAMGKQQSSRDPVKLQKTSYVRKGNSLVRNPGSITAQPPLSHGASQPVCPLKSPDLHDSKKSTGPGNGDASGYLLNQARAGISITTAVRPQTPPVSNSSNSQSDIVFSACSPSSQAVEPVVTLDNATSDPMECDNVLKSNEELNLFKTDLDRAVMPTGLLSRNEADDENTVICNAKKITYVKRKSNQLVASVNDPELPSQMVDKTQTVCRDGYYKSKKNQLIRTSADGLKQPTGFGTEAQVSTSQTYGSKKSQKAAARASKLSKSSLVWTLHSSLLSKSNSDVIDHPKAFPHLFPWKRPTYWRNFVLHRTRDKSSSAISSRLVHLRRRDAVYVRSSHGLSLRKAKVVSVGGSNLKWSKSIDKRSKKANEEATRAVAAADKEKRELNGASSVGSGTKNKNRSLRERIFRIGSFRYKMDSSRRTLIRISDESSGSAASQLGTVEKKSYVPRRLMIGNEEYVRIGNGNKLIRDPKKLTRVLASEKVRWSLHTARQRLAKKQKYCQFFTRFGKCNKGDGKCSYIHDPSKIAVCTKFLTGSCFNKDCKLTHKVIPERMPDCSYFLQGLCTNWKCPYRHVNVNPKATTCEGFLKGYCADGDECRKKHTYVCPSFEETGSCPQGSKCKLHHPKPHSKKGKKRKRSATSTATTEEKKKKKNSSSGRYFGGSKRVTLSEPGKTITGATGISFDEDEGELGDYIGLPDVSDEERSDDKMNEDVEASFMDDDDSLDAWRFSDLDDHLIKPIKIMKV